MSAWTKAIVKLHDPVSDAIAKIDAGSIQIALVVDDKGKLKGTVTDGDVFLGQFRGGGPLRRRGRCGCSRG